MAWPRIGVITRGSPGGTDGTVFAYVPHYISEILYITINVHSVSSVFYPPPPDCCCISGKVPSNDTTWLKKVIRNFGWSNRNLDIKKVIRIWFFGSPNPGQVSANGYHCQLSPSIINYYSLDYQHFSFCNIICAFTYDSRLHKVTMLQKEQL